MTDTQRAVWEQRLREKYGISAPMLTDDDDEPEARVCIEGVENCPICFPSLHDHHRV